MLSHVHDSKPNGQVIVSGVPATALAARVTGIIRAPRQTFAEVAARPTWAGVVLLTSLVTFGCSALLLRTEVGRFALVDQWERIALAFGQAVDDARYAGFERLSEHGVGYAALSAVLGGPVLTVTVALALMLVTKGIMKQQASLRQSLAIAAHAGVVLALRQVIAAPVNYLSETLASPTTLIQVVSTFAEAHPLARLLGVIDVFVLWWIVLLAIGVASLDRRPARPLALAFSGVYVVLALLLALAMALSGGTA